MVNDLVTEMRDLADCCPQRCHEVLLQGADEIERLTRERDASRLAQRQAEDETSRALAAHALEVRKLQGERGLS